jgi:hypothetical protein
MLDQVLGSLLDPDAIEDPAICAVSAAPSGRTATGQVGEFIFIRKAQTEILGSCRFRRVLQLLADWRDRNQTVRPSQDNVMYGQRGSDAPCHCTFLSIFR